jgi:lysophospholipid acyltransferase (LPLAT)-like uncharacterized protein
LTGLPILPVGVHIVWKRQFHSWDRFQLPLPLSPCRVRMGPLIRVPPQIGEEERGAFRRIVEAQLRALTTD